MAVTIISSFIKEAVTHLSILAPASAPAALGLSSGCTAAACKPKSINLCTYIPTYISLSIYLSI